MKKLIWFLGLLFIVCIGALGVYYYTVFDLNKLKMAVLIRLDDSNGSGVRITPDYVITNHHVVGDSKKVKVINYKNEIEDGEVVLIHPYVDIAVIKLEKPNYNYARLYCYPPIFGQNVYAVGRSEFINLGFTPLRVSSNWFNFPSTEADKKVQDTAGPNRLLLTGRVTFGSSGSGIFMFDNSVIGIADLIMTSRKTHDTMNFTVAVSMEDICEWLEENDIPFKKSFTPNLSAMMKSIGYSNGYTNKQDLANNMTNLLKR